MFLQKQKFINIFGALVFCCFAVLVPISATASGLVPCGGDTSTASDTGKPCTVQDAFILVARVTNWLLAVAGIYAVYRIVFSGFNLVTSMGNEEKITKNKESISNAVVGFVLAMLAFVFVNTAVNFILLNGDSSKKLDLTQPMCYLYPGASGCTTK